uniref:Leucine-rich repeat and immunoglobulin-like domain-containing nogo receptor-interacting protein 3 n=1 Tax=Phallusia mammillata TaxID=59560 RepID=A0A6F9DK79_9ASCI|nr:leucine-rich repeat and immunoglobulin-like domain-containing nogo receptor-interacting protein 3 [Phallusia mammillata]
MAYFVTLVWIVLCLQCTITGAFKCHQFCQCEQLLPTSQHRVVCNGVDNEPTTNISLVNVTEEKSCEDVLQVETLNFSFPIRHLEISCFHVSSQQKLDMFTTLHSLTITKTNLTSFSLKLVQSNTNLQKLNLSSNMLKTFQAPYGALLGNLQTLDLSDNALTNLDVAKSTLPQIVFLNLQNNQLRTTVPLTLLTSLENIDISGNSFSTSLNLSMLTSVHTFTAKKVHSIYKFNVDTSCSKCPMLPINAETVDLQNNALLQVPTCTGLLAGLFNLTQLQLDYNQISMLSENTFSGECFFYLSSLYLSHNRLVKIDSSVTAVLSNIRFWDVSYNYLQHIDPKILQTFNKFVGNGSTIDNEVPTIVLNNNSWSCDCFLTTLQNWVVQTPQAKGKFVCQQPSQLYSRHLEDLVASDLVCHNASILQPHNVTAAEFQSGTLVCSVSGSPRPVVHWITPKKENISFASIAQSSNQQDCYSLSEFGDMLTVHNVRLFKTGVYRCVADNNISTTEATVALSVLLGQTSTIILLSVACVAFMIAVVVNSINMCMYICEHVERKRQYKKALQAQKEEEKINPPIKYRSKSLDESMASLNANRHYSRYDFTCQQMFLDTVVKGAHTVKKTLYDARHSEFSNNMWGYAANLRDRLHIEMPSGVQLPSISMPSISMPSISMPTMPNIPTMQDINTNIEKLGSSVMHRSHNLATSVGSVFTLRRWMWQTQNNSSDNESRDSDDNLLGDTGVTRVRVDVHPRHHRSYLSGSEPSVPNTEQPSSSKDDQAGPSYIKVYRPTLQRSKSFTKNVRFDSDNRIEQQLPVERPLTSAIFSVHPNLNTISSTVDAVPLHSYETSV